MRRLAIVVPSHNRAASLRRTLQSLLPPGEAPASAAAAIIVVDNNSTDDTPAVAAAFGDRLRYVREPRQGLSFARNAGIETARALGAALVAFIDDDVEAAPGWAEGLVRAFDAHPHVDCVGGRVVPSNEREFPAWLTREHWGPLALQDHGPDPLVFDASSPRGLVGANFAFRAAVFERLGGFSASVQRVKDGIGSTEDHEMLQRLYDGGGRALYCPDIVVRTEVPPERLTRDYHRRWHRGHGRFTARMRLPGMERAPRGRVFGVPAHLFRSAAGDAVRWVRLTAAQDRSRAFEAETRLWFFSGFFQERCACAGRR